MRKKPPFPFSQKFPNVDPEALRLLELLLAFDPKDHPTAEEALVDPYFYGLANVDREPSTQPISKLEFEFERRKLAKDDVRELIYREKHYGKGEGSTPLLRLHVFLLRERVLSPNDENDQVDGENNVASMTQYSSESASSSMTQYGSEIQVAKALEA
ncbi:Mitogen-activated protein kinase 16 [Hibiscus syriacus]|uniref:Mitogen-activated protein kinase 16 n=1 Tax=Hibiscus syriacus TaxID=106335 RepID=A0A6A2ZB37_HIBSY|nr:mitogen-activated protein kinase 9-like [Hibiscus syriacus]KAE8689128.1 Mitogen-activated protein kinase 16 [Hibiscus syriacus]